MISRKLKTNHDNELVAVDHATSTIEIMTIAKKIKIKNTNDRHPFFEFSLHATPGRIR